jgi:hypothetical protein
MRLNEYGLVIPPVVPYAKQGDFCCYATNKKN